MNSVNLDKYSDPFFLGETKEELRRIRQDFHVHPEIGLVTPRTSRIIADLLKDYGVDEVGRIFRASHFYCFKLRFHYSFHVIPK